MGPLSDWLGDFNPGEALGVGLDTRQLGLFAGSLFFALFSVSAVRRAQRGGALVAAVWLAVAAGLLAGALALAACVFQDHIPDDLRPWAEPDRLTRLAAVLAVVGLGVVLLSAHWLRGPSARFACRLTGLVTAGAAVWLAAGWFTDAVHEEIRPWAARTVVTRGVMVLALLCLAGMFWVRPVGESAYVTWARRILTVPCLALAAHLSVRWFGAVVGVEFPQTEFRRVLVTLTAVAMGTCVLISGGAYVLRDRAGPTVRDLAPAACTTAPTPVGGRRLPVAVLLDDQGRPFAPKTAEQASRSHPASGAGV